MIGTAPHPHVAPYADRRLAPSLLRRLPPPRLARAPLLAGTFVWLFLRGCIGYPASLAALALGALLVAMGGAVVALVESHRRGDMLLLGNLGVGRWTVALLGALPAPLLDAVVGPALPDVPGLLVRMGG